MIRSPSSPSTDQARLGYCQVALGRAAPASTFGFSRRKSAASSDGRYLALPVMAQPGAGPKGPETADGCDQLSAWNCGHGHLLATRARFCEEGPTADRSAPHSHQRPDPGRTLGSQNGHAAECSNARSDRHADGADGLSCANQVTRPHVGRSKMQIAIDPSLERQHIDKRPARTRLCPRSPACRPPRGPCPKSASTGVPASREEVDAPCAVAAGSPCRLTDSPTLLVSTNGMGQTMRDIDPRGRGRARQPPAAKGVTSASQSRDFQYRREAAATANRRSSRSERIPAVLAAHAADVGNQAGWVCRARTHESQASARRCSHR